MGTNWHESRKTGKTPRDQARSDRALLWLTRRRRVVVWGTVVLLVVMIAAVVAL